jgi:NAD(P)-dependent dehydrogenase (short-subunit alcohol dehydrogenase family)
MTLSNLSPSDGGGRTIFIIVHGPVIAEGLAEGLRDAGCQVAVLSDVGRPLPSGVVVIPTGFGGTAAIEQALAAAVERIGPPDCIIHASAPASALRSVPVSALGDQRWRSDCLGALKATFFTLQACFAAFKERGARILLIGPALSLVGAEGLVPLSTALEGQRALAKSAARQWGSHGIVINWLAVASTVFAPELAEAKLPRPVSPEPLALGTAPTLPALVPLILAMADKAGAVLAGATLCLDGGEVMTP